MLLYVFYRKGDILGESVTLSKDTLYGGIIVVLAILLVGSVFTQGYGIVPCPATPAANNTAPVQPSQPSGTNGTAQPSQPAANDSQPTASALPSLTVVPGDTPALGNTSAPVMIVQFSEFLCPYCQKLYQEAEHSVRQNYVDQGKASLYYRDYLVHGAQAVPPHLAARCADEQGKFWAMHDKLYEDRDTWLQATNDSVYTGYASELGLDTAQFETCMAGDTYMSVLTNELAAGQALGVGGTPTSFIVIKKSAVSESDLSAALDTLALTYGNALTLYEDSDEYTVMVPGAYPYDVFEAVLKTVNY